MVILSFLITFAIWRKVKTIHASTIFDESEQTTGTNHRHESEHDLPEDLRCVGFWVTAFLGDAIEELAAYEQITRRINFVLLVWLCDTSSAEHFRGLSSVHSKCSNEHNSIFSLSQETAKHISEAIPYMLSVMFSPKIQNETHTAKGLIHTLRHAWQGEFETRSQMRKKQREAAKGKKTRKGSCVFPQEERTSAVFHDNVHVHVVFVNIEKFDNVLVVEVAHNVDLIAKLVKEGPIKHGSRCFVNHRVSSKIESSVLHYRELIQRSLDFEVLFSSLPPN